MIRYRIRLERLEEEPILGARTTYQVARDVTIEPLMLEGTRLGHLQAILQQAFGEVIQRAGEQDLYLARPVQGHAADFITTDEARPNLRQRIEARPNLRQRIEAAAPTRPTPRTSHTGW